MQIKVVDLKHSPQTLFVEEDTEFVGLYIGDDSQQISTRLRFVHQCSDVTSRIHLKAVLYNHSELDLQPIVEVKAGATNTDTYLRVETLLMSDEAKAHVVPSMEIHEDQVKGGHGASVGQPDRTQLDYLCSKGLGLDMAKQLLVEAFISEIKQKIAKA